MQQQQDTQRPNPPTRRPHRSVLELIAAWFILLLGVVWSIGGWAGVIAMRQIPPRESELAFIALWASAIIFALQGIACFLAGLFVLLKYRLIARWLLTGIALCFVVLSGVLFFEGKFFQGKMAPYNILLNCFTAVIYLGFGALFFRLGRRQGRQEDIERKEAGRKL